MKVFVEGRLSTTSWDDQSSGRKMYKTEVVITDMMILGYPKGMEASDSDVVEDKLPQEGDDFDLSDFDVSDDDANEKSEGAGDDGSSDETGETDETKEESGEETPF